MRVPFFGPARLCFALDHELIEYFLKQLTEKLKHALCIPPNAGMYELAHALSEMYPGSAVRSTGDSSFDLENFLRYGLGDGHVEERLWGHYGLMHSHAVHEYPVQAWRTITWKSQEIQVISVLFHRCMMHFIVGETHEVVNGFFAAVCRFHDGVEGEVLVVENGVCSRDQELELAFLNAPWENLILDDALRTDLVNQCELFFRSEELYRSHGVRWRRGILLTGDPGNGKTQFIRSMVSHLKRRTLIVKELTDYCDDPAVGEVFTAIRHRSPCLVIMEDLDSLIPKDSLSEFLNELDGAKGLDGVLILASTNHPERLDPALKNRPSRFDRIVEFGPPTEALRREYFSRVLPVEEGLEAVVQATEGLSFAMLNEVRISALFQRVYDPEAALADGLVHFAGVVREQFEAKPTADGLGCES